MEPIIQVCQLSKHFKVYKHHRGTLGAVRNLFSREFKIVKAVNEISFQVYPGELVGYIGPNGAGKSTTIKMLTGLLVPTTGKLQVNGLIPWRDRQEYVARIGAVFGQRTTLWWDLPVIESLALLQHIYNIPVPLYEKNLSEFRELLALDPFLNTPVRALSLGQRMRADICASLMHNPDLLFLDEPTIGLDVVAKERIRHFIDHINHDRHTTIVLTTHDLQDVEKLCKRVMILDDGRLLFDGSLNSLKNQYSGDRQLMVEFSEHYPNYEITGAKIVHQENQRVIYSFERHAITASELIGRLTQKYHIHDLSVREPELEATIRRIYEDRLLSKRQ